MSKGEIATAEIVVERSCHRDCNHDPEKITVTVAGEVWCPNNDEMDAELHSQCANGRYFYLTPKEETDAEDALIDTVRRRWLAERAAS